MTVEAIAQVKVVKISLRVDVPAAIIIHVPKDGYYEIYTACPA